MVERRGEWLIRPYERTDRGDVRRLAGEAAWSEADTERAIPDRELWADLATAYFTDREPENAQVIAREDGAFAGYLLGTADILNWEKFLVLRVPRLLLRTITSGLLLRGDSRRAMASISVSALRGELIVPAKVQVRFPGTFRMAIKAEARGQGIGAVLITRFIDRMRSLGVRGVHVQALGIDGELSRFVQRAGFQLAASWPVRTWRHVESTPIDLLTWVLPL